MLSLRFQSEVMQDPCETFEMKIDRQITIRVVVPIGVGRKEKGHFVFILE